MAQRLSPVPQPTARMSAAARGSVQGTWLWSCIGAALLVAGGAPARRRVDGARRGHHGHAHHGAAAGRGRGEGLGGHRCRHGRDAPHRCAHEPLQARQWSSHRSICMRPRRPCTSIGSSSTCSSCRCISRKSPTGPSISPMQAWDICMTTGATSGPTEAEIRAALPTVNWRKPHSRCQQTHREICHARHAHRCRRHWQGIRG